MSSSATAPPSEAHWNQAFARRDLSQHQERTVRWRKTILYYVLPAAVVVVVSALILGALQPPMVQTHPRNSMDHGRVSPLAVAGWSLTAGILTLVITGVLRWYALRRG